MVKIAICEDDKFYIEKEKQIIKSYFEEKDLSYELYLFKSGVELIKDYRVNYDIIFLDISMDEMNGLEVANILRKKGTSACIVFLTAYAEYSIEGYEVDAHRYLLKNSENIEELLYECLTSALEKLQITENKIDFDVQGGVLTVSPAKIVYAESNAHRVVLYILENTGDLREYCMYDRLDNIQEKIENFGFSNMR